MNTPLARGVVYEGMRTPWGGADSAEVYTFIDNRGEIGPHAGSVTTPGHGGLKLDRKRNAQIPDYMRHRGGWYEEDCAFAIPLLVMPGLEEAIWRATRDYGKLTLDEFRSMVRRTVRAWYWRSYERFTGETVAPGESHGKDDYLWHKANAGKWMMCCGYDPGHPSWPCEPIPPGHVGFQAAVNGRGFPDLLLPAGRVKRYFICKKEHYGSGVDNMLVDPAIHREVFPKVNA